MPDGRTKQLITHVMWRLHLVGIGRSAFWALLVLAGVYFVAMLTARLMGWYGEVFEWWTVLILPALAALVGLLVHRRPSEAVAARLADERAGTHDLFLTAAMLDSAAGDYKPLVTQAAEDEAPRVQPSVVVPFDWTGRTAQACMVLGVLVLSALYLNPPDIFGRQEQAAKEQQQLKQIEEVKQIAAQRAAALERRQVDAVHSAEVEQKLEELKNEFNKMKPNNPQENRRRLMDMQRSIGEQWKKISERRAQDANRRRTSTQRLGQSGARMTDEWKEQIQQGRTDGMQQEMDRLKELAQELSQTQDEQRQQELRDKIQQGLENMAEFSQSEAGSKSLTDALNQAAKMAETAGKESVTQEAAEALEQALNQSEMELEQLAQSVRDMKSLEEALKTVQEAKALNEVQPLDGEQLSQAEALEQYREMMQQQQQNNGGQQGQQNQNQSGQACSTCSGSGCRSCGGTGKQPGGQSGQAGGQQPGGQQAGGQEGQQGQQPGGSQPGGGAASPGEMAENQDFGGASGGAQPGGQGGGQGAGSQPGQGGQPGSGSGGGMGGPGRGAGNIAPEDASQPFDFETQKSNSRLTAGRMLLEWKTKGVSEKGDTSTEYKQALSQVKREASAAVNSEEIPPGYREAIKNYFDTIDRTVQPGAEQESAQPAGAAGAAGSE